MIMLFFLYSKSPHIIQQICFNLFNWYLQCWVFFFLYILSPINLGLKQQGLVISLRKIAVLYCTSAGRLPKHVFTYSCIILLWNCLDFNPKNLGCNPSLPVLQLFPRRHFSPGIHFCKEALCKPCMYTQHKNTAVLYVSDTYSIQVQCQVKH